MFHLPRAVQCALIASASSSSSPSSLRYTVRCIGTSTDGPKTTRRGSAPVVAGGRRRRASAHTIREANTDTGGGTAGGRSASSQGTHIDYAGSGNRGSVGHSGVIPPTRAAATTGAAGVTPGNSASQLSMQRVIETNRNWTANQQAPSRMLRQTAPQVLQGARLAVVAQPTPVSVPAVQQLRHSSQHSRQMTRTPSPLPVQPLPMLSSLRPPATKGGPATTSSIAKPPTGTVTTPRAQRTPRRPRGVKAAGPGAATAVTAAATVNTGPTNISAATTAGARMAAAAIVARASPTRVAQAVTSRPPSPVVAASARPASPTPDSDARAAVQRVVQAVNAAVKSATPTGASVPVASMATRPRSRAAVEEAMRAVEAAVTAARAVTATPPGAVSRSRAPRAPRSPRTPWGTRPAATSATKVSAAVPAASVASAQGHLRSATTTPMAESRRKRSSGAAERETVAGALASPGPGSPGASTTVVLEAAATEAAVARALAAAAAAAKPSKRKNSPRSPRAKSAPPLPQVTVVTPVRASTATVAPPSAIRVVTPTRASRSPTLAKSSVPIVIPGQAPTKPQVTVVTPQRRPQTVVSPRARVGAATATGVQGTRSLPSKPEVTVVTPKRTPRAISAPAKPAAAVRTPTRGRKTSATPAATSEGESATVPAEETPQRSATAPVVSSVSRAESPKRGRKAAAKKGTPDVAESPSEVSSAVALRAITVTPTATHEETTRSSNGQTVTTVSGVANPFRGLHDHITRSYRLDQLQAAMKPHDLLLGRQEIKSGAFSFIRFACGPKFMEDHKESLAPNLLGGANGAREKKAGSRNGGRGGEDCPLVVAERLLAFPPHMHHFHTICGRENIPCDFFADIDLPNETPAGGEKTLLEVLNYLDVRLEAIGFVRPSYLVLTNEAASADKVSYHLHARSMGAPEDGDGAAAATPIDSVSDRNGGASADKHSAGDGMDQGKGRLAGAGRSKASNGKIVAFQDYRVVKLLADEVNTTLGRTVIDEQCYRANGMLRCAYSSKITVPHGMPLSSSSAGGYHRGKRLVPLLKAKDSALQKRLDAIASHLYTLSDAQILERSFCIRTAPAKGRRVKDNEDCDNAQMQARARGDYLRSFKLIRAKNIVGDQNAQPVEYDAYGNAVSRFLTESSKWRRFKMAVEKLHRLPPRAAECYDIWVRVGLALHNFSNEDHVFEEWVRFSLKCPQKYSRETCRRKWQQFDRNPDALNWRRGFNYLNSTVWRSVPGA